MQIQTIKHKYNTGQKVFTMKDNKVIEVCIGAVIFSGVVYSEDFDDAMYRDKRFGVFERAYILEGTKIHYLCLRGKTKGKETILKDQIEEKDIFGSKEELLAIL